MPRRKSSGGAVVEGETVWRVATANRMAVIVDAADYFAHAKAALLKAQHGAMLIGWDFDARVELEPDGQTLDGPNRVGSFLNWVARKRPELKISILKWDLGVLQSLGRGETPFFIANWMEGGRVRLKLDAAHPKAAAHHMKLLVIDDAVAFCGGIDMTVGRWDRRAHAEKEPARRDPGGKPLMPWHDATTCVDGPAARALADLARERWRRATGETLPAAPEGSDPWPDGLASGLDGAAIGIARTLPAFDDYKQVSEIEALTLRLIASAKNTLYIESQYFASRTIAEAIVARLGEKNGPEIVVINPETADGWLESATMDSARVRLLHLVRSADVHGRFRMFYPVNAKGTPIYVHAKIMAVDDIALKVGSANLNNRSMGFDTETDLVLDAAASANPAAARRFVTATRNDLLAEHLGTEVADVVGALKAHGGSLIGAIDALNTKKRGLRLLKTRELSAAEELLAETDLLDPERPPRFTRRIGRRLSALLPRFGRG